MYVKTCIFTEPESFANSRSRMSPDTVNVHDGLRRATLNIQSRFGQCMLPGTKKTNCTIFIVEYCKWTSKRPYRRCPMWATPQ